MSLPYAKFIKDLLKAKGMTMADLARQMKLPEARIYEFLDGQHEPRASLVKAVELELEITHLGPEYYGYGETKKASEEDRND